MGITGELVRHVFSKSQSIRSHDTNYVKNNVMEKKRWKRTVRAYLCGDDLLFNSVLAEEDTTSVKSSEASVTQRVPRGNGSTDSGEDFNSDQATQQHDSSDQDHSHCANSPLPGEDVAAVIIQAAFRGFMVRRLRTSEFARVKNDLLKGFDSPSRESLGTSIEVQTGNSIGVVSVQEECLTVCTKLQDKPKYSFFRQKDDWDDSTVNSSVSKMRYQNRLEAMTRRERALAYAFSQQLRICSKKKQIISDNTEPNTSWSWLERWMATRQHEGLPVEDRISKQLNEPAVRKNFLNLSFEEKESCGSNEIPRQVISSAYLKGDDEDGYKSSSTNRLKSPRNVSRRKTFPTGHYQKEHTKVNKREGSRETEYNRSQTVKQLGSTSVCVYKDDASNLSADHSVAA